MQIEAMPSSSEQISPEQPPVWQGFWEFLAKAAAKAAEIMRILASFIVILIGDSVLN